MVIRTLYVCIAASALLLGLASATFAEHEKKKKVRKARTSSSSCSAGSSSSLARYKIEKGEALPAAIPKPLTKKAGDAKRGLEVAVNPGKGNCLACHHIAKVLAKADKSDPKSVKLYGNHGEVGPPLNGVGARYTTSELRMIVVDPKKAFPDVTTVMPAYHARTASKDVKRACRGRVMLSAQSVEDIVTFLEELK
jgi:sulfur-oxidizing protein SoxX